MFIPQNKPAASCKGETIFFVLKCFYLKCNGHNREELIWFWCENKLKDNYANFSWSKQWLSLNRALDIPWLVLFSFLLLLLRIWTVKVSKSQIPSKLESIKNRFTGWTFKDILRHFLCFATFQMIQLNSNESITVPEDWHQLCLKYEVSAYLIRQGVYIFLFHTIDFCLHRSPLHHFCHLQNDCTLKMCLLCLFFSFQMANFLLGTVCLFTSAIIAKWY